MQISRRRVLIIVLCSALVGAAGFFLYAKKAENWSDKIVSEAIEKVLPKETSSAAPKTIGLLMFRGNMTRTFYGTGPIPTEPRVLWRYPDHPMCSPSIVFGVTKTWCGSGWTGQPVVWERPDNITEIIFGAYDKNVHFVDAATGKDTRPSFKTGDIIKGSVSMDPDGFPLIYFGSRDNFLRIVALDRDIPTELWHMEARVSDGVWNNDWDGNPLIRNGILYEGSENGIFHIIKLNRSHDADGKVQLSPVEIFSFPTFSKELEQNIGDKNQSIESSPVVYKDRVYTTNSGGRVLGFDISRVDEGIVTPVFDFWAGDDVDATPIVDEEGMLYIVSEKERFTPRSLELGQLMKLDPYTAENPIIWSKQIPETSSLLGGAWATPALRENKLYVITNPGKLLVLDKDTGAVLDSQDVGPHAWSSPNIVDNTVIIGSCSGYLKAFTLGEKLTPLWTLPVGNGGCIESSPAIWKGHMYFGTRDGYFYAVGQK